MVGETGFAAQLRNEVKPPATQRELLSQSGHKKNWSRRSETSCFMDGRGDRIRTCDPLVPNQMRYQAALLPEPAANDTRILACNNLKWRNLMR